MALATLVVGAGLSPLAIAQIELQSGATTTVNLDIPEFEISVAMQMLADATGLNILVSPKATGKVTAYILEMKPEQALEEIARVNGLHYVRNGDVVWVLTGEEFFDDLNLGREQRVVVLKHAHASEMVGILTGGILGPVGTAIAHPENNVVVVGEDKDRIEEVIALVHQLDVPPDTEVFQLQYASAADLIPLLQTQLLNPNALQVDGRTNQVLVTAPMDTLARIGTLISEFDKPDKVATRIFRLHFADAIQTADLIREVLTGKKQSGEGGFGNSSVSNDEQPTVFTTEPGRNNQSARPQDRWSQMRAPRVEGQGAPPSSPTTNTSGPDGSAPTTAPLDGGISGGEEVALGPLSSVAADPRTNSVIVTHVASVLDRIEQIINTIDVQGVYHTYQFKHVNPAELGLEQRLLSMLPLENPLLSVDEGTRKVTFRASAQQAEDILALLHSWDDPVPQVRIEADVLRVNLTFLRDLGVSWQAVSTELTENIPLGATDGISEIQRVISVGGDSRFAPNFGESVSRAELSIGNLGDDDYSAIIRAVRDDNDSQIIASPNALVRDGQEASFSSVRDQPYTVVTVDGNTQTTLEDVRFLNVGLSLFVAPVINPDGLITMDVQLEISNLVDEVNNTPVVDRSTAQSSVSIESGGTVMLAGLRQRARSKVTSGVPGLSRVPVVGNLFRSRRKQKDEQEIILLLRPTLIENREENVPMLGEVYEKNALLHEEETLGLDGKSVTVYPPEPAVDE